jgi:hypothetical protein
MKKIYTINFHEYINCLLNKDFESIDWNISDLLMVLIDLKIIIITINKNYEPTRHFMSYAYDSYINSIKLNKNVDAVYHLSFWKNDSEYKHYKVYNITKMIKDNILNKDCINTFLETKDNITRNMMKEIILNELNKLNNGNN